MQMHNSRLTDAQKDFDVFPASSSNEITYHYFCVLGGLSDPRCSKVMRGKGMNTYFTYHRIDAR